LAVVVAAALATVDESTVAAEQSAVPGAQPPRPTYTEATEAVESVRQNHATSPALLRTEEAAEKPADPPEKYMRVE